MSHINTTDSTIITGLNDDQPYMSMTSATINTARLKFIYNIVLKYMSRRNEANYHQLLNLNANLLTLVKILKAKRNQKITVNSNPNRPKANRNSANANYRNALSKLLERGHRQTEISRLLQALNTYVPKPKVIVKQPNGSNSLGY